MKKLLAILLAIVMVMGMATTAFAAETEHSITINGTAGHTYEVYQIFTGDLYEGILSNIVWGDGVTDAGRTALGDAATIAEGLEEDDIQAFLNSVSLYLTNPKDMVANDATYTLENLDPGYYLVKDKDGTQEEVNGTYTAYIIQVVGKVEMKPKDSVPSIDKSVTTDGNNADDFHINDTVTFILKATLGDDLSVYKNYKVIFHDEMSDTLSYKEFVKAELNDTDITNHFTFDREGQKLTFTSDNIIPLGAKAGDTVTITYTAILEENAVIGRPGNPNKVYLEYSNNPNWDTDGDGKPENPKEPDEPTGNTPEDVVIVFTYELDVTKVDGNNAEQTLSGADFVLLNSDKSQVATVENGTFIGWVDVPAAENGKIAWPEKAVLTSLEDGKFVVAGLDAGTYFLREIKAPNGYNLLASDIQVVITAELNTAEDQAALDALTITVGDGEPVDGDPETGVVSTTVENNSGATLPETGGMGTTLFYILGGVLVLAAVVLLVTKRRMNAAE